ncbi:hypothetical protein V1506DRAFT_542294 [Lipomyces tetrasporus]
MGFVREYLIERYYGGDRDAMTKIVPSPLRKAAGVPHVIECEVVNNTLNELRSKTESVASRFEVLATEYEARLQKSWTTFQDDSVKPQISDKDDQGVSIDGRALASIFIDIYALYLSNDPRRPYFDGSFA